MGHFNVVMQLETLVRMIQEAIKVSHRLGLGSSESDAVSSEALTFKDSSQSDKEDDLVLEMDYAEFDESAVRDLSVKIIQFVNSHLSSKTLHSQLLAVAGSSRVQHTY